VDAAVVDHAARAGARVHPAWAMAHHYLVVSDRHLCDVEEHADGWKGYESARHLFDPGRLAPGLHNASTVTFDDGPARLALTSECPGDDPRRR